MKLQRLQWIIIAFIITISTVPFLCLGVVINLREQEIPRENHLTIQRNSNEAPPRANAYPPYLTLFIAISFMATGGAGYIAAKMIINMLRKSHAKEKEMEMMVLQNEKMSSLGVITSGIAHELSNPLANALIYTQMLHEKLKEKYPTDDLSSMVIAEERLIQCGAIIKNLMTFARRSSLEVRDVNVNEVIRGLANMTEKYFKENQVSVAMHLQEDIPYALCNESIVHQTIMNMFTNAVEAMKQGGAVTIKTRHVAVSDMIEIDIQDSGVGIPGILIGKVFDPFFSTKPSGERNGLGLYISCELIKKSGGNIRVISCAESEGAHSGTIFTIDLPAVKRTG